MKELPVKKMILALALFSAPIMPGYGAAAAAENIECLRDQLTSEEEVQWARIRMDGSKEDWELSAQNREFLDDIVRVLDICVSSNGWSEAAAEQVYSYSLSRAIIAALEVKPPLTPLQMQKLRHRYFESDPTMMSLTADELLDAAAGKTPPGGDSGERYLKLTLEGLGVSATAENMLFAGHWMSAQRMMEKSKTSFAGL